MKTAIFCHGDKGGVGKTQVATRTAAVYEAAGKPLLLIDGDAKNPGLFDLCNTEKNPVLRCNVLKPEGLDEVFEAILAAECDILIDLPAGASAASEKFHDAGAEEGSIDFEALLAEAGVRAVVLFAIDQNRESIAALRDELEAFPKETQWVVVKNMFQKRAFTLFDTSKTCGLVEERGGEIVELLRLASDITSVMANHSLDLNSLIGSEIASALQKMRARTALRDWTKQLQNVGLLDV